MSNHAPAWVVPAMRLGYGARGAVYAIVGGLAVLAAWRGRDPEGTVGALAQLQGQSWGVVALVAIVAGLAAYALWRIIDSILDLEDYGTDARGLVARTGMVVTGLLHLGLGAYIVAELLIGQTGDDSERARSITAALMQQGWGPWAIGIAGACTVAAGSYYALKGYREEYSEKLRLTPMTERLNPVMKFGLYSHGLVVALIGIFLFWAAWTYDPSQAGGLSQAFRVIHGAAFGRALLGVVALGLVGFAVFCFVNAVYRIVPRRSGEDVRTLAIKAERTAEAALR